MGVVAQKERARQWFRLAGSRGQLFDASKGILPQKVKPRQLSIWRGFGRAQSRATGI